MHISFHYKAMLYIYTYISIKKGEKISTSIATTIKVVVILKNNLAYMHKKFLYIFTYCIRKKLCNCRVSKLSNS